jgi:hypothetical protein
MNDRHFTAPVDEISGTVDEVSAGGITLNEYPGRRFQFSSVSTSAADMSARILGENNNLTRSEVAAEVDARRGALQDYLSSTFTSGDTARLVIPKGAAAASEQIRAVVLANGENVNRELIDRGYGEYREDLGGAEARAMHGVVGRHLGSMAEGLAFQGDSGPLNPMRNQGSPSRRTQRTSRVRQSKAHSMGCRKLLPCNLVLCQEGKLEWFSVSPNPKDLPRACARSPAATHRSITRLGSRQLSTGARAVAGISASPDPKRSACQRQKSGRSHNGKMLQFSLNPAIDSGGRICSQNVGGTGISLRALELMTLRNGFGRVFFSI